MCKHRARARQATDDNIIWRIRFACWISKATDRHSEFEILIAFLRLQWLCESTSILRYTHVACLLLVPYVIKSNCAVNMHFPGSSSSITMQTLCYPPPFPLIPLVNITFHTWILVITLVLKTSPKISQWNWASPFWFNILFWPVCVRLVFPPGFVA
jgi:hypothetical protein